MRRCIPRHSESRSIVEWPGPWCGGYIQFCYIFNYELNIENISFVIYVFSSDVDKGLVTSEVTMHYSSNYSPTNHSKTRASQRGFRKDVIDAVWQFADRESQRPGACFELSISSNRLALLVSKGQIKPHLAEKCSRAKLLTDGAILITVYKNDD